MRSSAGQQSATLEEFDKAKLDSRLTILETQLADRIPADQLRTETHFGSGILDRQTCFPSYSMKPLRAVVPPTTLECEGLLGLFAEVGRGMIESSAIGCEPSSISKSESDAVRICSGVVIVTLRGELSAAKFERIFRSMIGHPDFRKGMPALYDFRHVSLAKVTAGELRSWISVGRRHSQTRGEGHRVAGVVSGDADYGVARMFQAYAEGQIPQKLEIFESFPEALKWLTPD